MLLFLQAHRKWGYEYLLVNQYYQGLPDCWVVNLQNQAVPKVTDQITAVQSATSILPETWSAQMVGNAYPLQYKMLPRSCKQCCVGDYVHLISTVQCSSAAPTNQQWRCDVATFPMVVTIKKRLKQSSAGNITFLQRTETTKVYISHIKNHAP